MTASTWDASFSTSVSSISRPYAEVVSHDDENFVQTRSVETSQAVRRPDAVGVLLAVSSARIARHALVFLLSRTT